MSPSLLMVISRYLTRMAQILIRQLDEDTKTKLQRMARQHGRSTEEEVREILRRARRRFRKMPVTYRPALDKPTSAVGLFSMPELTTLAIHQFWPLPESVLTWFRKTPKLDRHMREIKVDLKAVAAAVTDLESRGGE